MTAAVSSRKSGAGVSGKRPRIALIGLGANSFTNPSVARMLEQQFPDCDVDWIDLNVELERQTHNTMRVLTSIHGIKEFHRAMGARLWEVRWRRYWTTFLFELRSRAAQAAVATRDNYLFSFQMQSLFDAAVPGIPNFVYTDNTVLAHRQYADCAERDVPVSDLWLRLERKLYHGASTNFVMSSNVGRSMIEDYSCDPESVVCAYGGPNIPLSLAPQERYDRKNVLFVGVNWKNKGGPQLLEAFRVVRARIPDATLTIVGCSPDIKESGVQVVGRIPPSEVAQHYANASVFCLPTLREAFGISFIEAITYKLPVVAPKIAAIPDFVIDGKNGYTVAPGDVAAYADRLTSLLADESVCRRMGASSWELSKRYTWQNTGSIMRTAIQKKLARPRPTFSRCLEPQAR